MTALDDAATDGRNARRERNVNHVLDNVMAMFADDAMFPTMDGIAERSGLSLRSLYRYFADPAELLHAAIDRHQVLTAEAAHLVAIGEGPLSERIDDFASMRVRVYEQFGPAFRATLANAARHQVVRDVLQERRNAMRTQFDCQFRQELATMGPERTAVLAAGDALSQLETVHLMAEQGLSSRQIRAALNAGLRALFASQEV